MNITLNFTRFPLTIPPRICVVTLILLQRKKGSPVQSRYNQTIMGALGWVSLSLFSLISATYRSVSPNLSPVSDWQTLTFSFASEDRFLLVSLRSKRGGRTLLTADFAENETADWSEETRLWTVRAEFSDVEGWAHNVSETAVQVPARGKDV